MYTIVQIIQENPKIQPQPPKLKDFIDEIMVKLKDMFKNYLVQYSTIQTFQRRTVGNNMCQLSLNIMTIYDEVFKIFIKLKVNFQASFSSNWTIEYTIDSPNVQIMQMIPELRDTIQILKIIFPLTRPFVSSPTRTINLFQRVSFSHIQNTTFYALQIMKKLRLPYSICDSIIHEFSKKVVYERLQNVLGIQNTDKIQQLEEIFKAPSALGLIEKQSQRYSNYFKEEGTKKGFLKNPAFIPVRRANQVTRSIYFDPTKKRQEKKMTAEVSQKFKGSFSKISHIIEYGQKISTFCYNRKGKGKENEKIEPNIFLSQREEKMELICKQVGGNQTKREAAIKSFDNEVRYLKLKGSINCQFICNYYFEVREPGKESKIYLDYHPISVWDKFYNLEKNCYTMSDIINFGEQVMSGLIKFYLEVDFLHRDIKENNILISKEGVIQIIDHGSVYPFDSHEKIQRHINQLSDLRKKFDSILRSTIYVNREIYEKNKYYILRNYKNYLEYTKKSNTHRTFDVYSVGIILSQMNRYYYCFQHPIWMEVCGRWDCLIDKMTQLDPQRRIQMEDALHQIQQLRAFIFRNF